MKIVWEIKVLRRAGEIQIMSAGTGITHSEYNDQDEETLLFQIWVQPQEINLKPKWENINIDQAENENIDTDQVGNENIDIVQVGNENIDIDQDENEIINIDQGDNENYQTADESSDESSDSESESETSAANQF